MRDDLKSIFSKEIVLEDNSRFSYTITPYEFSNALGNSAVVLQEYNFTQLDDKKDYFPANYIKRKRVAGIL